MPMIARNLATSTPMYRAAVLARAESGAMEDAEAGARRGAELIPLVSYGSRWECVGSRCRVDGTSVPSSRFLVLRPRLGGVLARCLTPDMIAGVVDRGLEMFEEMVRVT